MKRTITASPLIVLVLALLQGSCASSKETAQQKALTPKQQDKITEIITKMPAAGHAEQQWMNAQLQETGPAGIHALADMLNAPGSGDDTYARYAVNGLAKYVTRPDAETERAAYEKALLGQLESDYSDPVKSFLMEQLELTGSDQAVPVLRSFLGDDRLYESAVHALKAINTPQAQQALLQELPMANGHQRVALITALGNMEFTAAEDLMPHANSGDTPTRQAALYALANSGNPNAAASLAASGSASLNLRFAKRLGEEGHKQQSSEICRKLLDGDHPVHIQAAALYILVQQNGEESMDDVLNAAENPNPQLRSAALELARAISGNHISDAFIDRLQQADPAVQADIIAMLGRRGDPSILPDLTTYLQDNNLEVRLAAIASVAVLGGEKVLPDLMETLKRSEQPREIEAAKTALLQLPTQLLLQATAEALPRATEPAKAALIKILAERQGSGYFDTVISQLENSNDAVRMAVFHSLKELATPDDLSRLIAFLPEAQTPEERTTLREAIIAVSSEIPESGNRSKDVIQALNQAPDAQKPYLLPVLSGIGGKQALDRVVAATKSSDNAVQQAAMTALADWSDASAAQPLLQVLKSAPDSNRNTLLEGFIGIVQNSKYSSQDQVRFLSDAMAAASSAGEQAKIIEAWSMMQSPAALRAVAEYFDSPDTTVREQSYRAAAEILAPAYDRSSDFDGADKVLAVLESRSDSTTKLKIEQFITEFQSREQTSEGFTSLFNGRDFSGWTGDKQAYLVKDGQIIHHADSSGNLFTEEQYADFILRFEFKLTPGANNGLGIRAPLEGDPAYDAMELQILDNKAEKYADLQPFQYHGSVYGVVPSERGHLKPAGQWNTQEVIARGSQVTVKLNGTVILDADIEKAGLPKPIDGKDHPGLLRERGHIGFLGHGDKVAFRNIRIRDLNTYYPSYASGSGNGDGMNQPPHGFKALFNGQNLDGWKGLVENPEARAVMSKEDLAESQQHADSAMHEHWSVRDGILIFDGKGESLATGKDYKDFEMLVDWKIEPGGDSGVYLRGSPQVQIWDITEWPQGSGGLYNNQEHLSDPLWPADNAIGEWNTMRIKMIGDRVTVHLNEKLVVPNVVLENYWNRDKPIYTKGQIELQSHSTPLYFKNIFIREIPRMENLFNGEDLSGWQPVGGDTDRWQADEGILYTGGNRTEGADGGWISTTEKYDNFKLELEYRLPEGGNSGVFLRASREGDPAYQGIEIQLLDDRAQQYAGLEPWQYTGSVYDVQAPSKKASKPAGQWQKMVIVADGPAIRVTLNGEMIINTSLINHMNRVQDHPGLKRRKGYIGLQNHNTRVEFRNIKITETK